MITNFQEREIKDYLQRKNLSAVIMNEIYDHFVVQISELMNENLNFQEAFLKTKVSWQHELEMVRADVLSYRKVARIEKKVLTSRFRNIVLSSVFFTILGFGILLILNDYFYMLQVGLMMILVVSLFYNFVFREMKFKEYYELIFHPLILRNIILGCIFFFGISYFVQITDFLELEVNKMFSLYAIIVQIQLLYFRSKKVNVLI